MLKPEGAPVSWSLRDRLVVFGTGGTVIACIYAMSALARRDGSGRLYTRTWHWVDATPRLVAVPAMLVTAAIAFALLIPLYKRRFGGVLVGLISLALLAAEYTLFARIVGPVWQGPPFERWQLPLLTVALVVLAGGAGLALERKVLGVARSPAP